MLFKKNICVAGVLFGDHVERLQEAGRAVLKTVKAAFDKGRSPTTDDVLAITNKMDEVAAAVVAGRHAAANSISCGHDLAEFITEEDAFFCNDCRTTMPSGTQMAGCRQCDYDLCMTCTSTRRRHNSSGPTPTTCPDNNKTLEKSLRFARAGLKAKKANCSQHEQPRVAAARRHANTRRGSGAAGARAP